MDCVYFYDHLVIFRNFDHIKSKLCNKVQVEEDNVELHDNENALNVICRLLSEALKDRVSLVCPVRVCVKDKTDLQAIGLKYIGQLTHVLLTKGPPSNTPAGNEFRRFWGKKSELRRIDGDLCECIVWSNGPNVCMQIVNFVLIKKLHLSANPNELELWYHLLPNRLDPFISLHKRNRNVSLVTASSLCLIRALDKLRELLRGLNTKLPLNITAVLPLSSAFRDTAVFPSILSFPMADQSCNNKTLRTKMRHFSMAKWLLKNACFPVFPLYVIIHLEQSGRWPNDLNAFRHMKRLLVIRIHELLSPKGIPSHVTVNNMLDIFLQGLVFRIVISQSKELNLIQKLADCQVESNHVNKPPVKPGSGPLSTEISSESACWIRLNQSLPTLVGTLAGVSRTYAHVFPTACRLAKRWLSAQGYPVILCPYEAELDGLHNSSDFFPQPEECFSALSSWWLKEDINTSINDGGRMTEVAVELLVLYASKLSDSIDSDSNEVNLTSTGSPIVAFLQFLDLLTTYDWENVPLLVDLNGGFSDINKRQQAMNSFQRTPRNNLPALVICTPLDTTGTEWTEIGPSRAGLNDLKLIAGQTRDLLRAMLVSNASMEDLMIIFRPVFKKMDIVLNIQENIVNIRHLESLNGVLQRKKLIISETNKDNDLPMEFPNPGARFWPQSYCYDPLNWFVKLLQLRLGKFFEIRWDRHGGDWISLRWRSHFIQDMNSNDRYQFIQSVFNAELLDGLTQHADSNQLITNFGISSELPLVYNDNSLVKLLSIWFEKFIKLPIHYNSLSSGVKTSKKRKCDFEANVDKCVQNKRDKTKNKKTKF
ncbi:Nucleolar protein 6 [Schistosoma japonicum]|nr:Nucleolar protein 6 [Schistosoma japonicum]